MNFSDYTDLKDRCMMRLDEIERLLRNAKQSLSDNDWTKLETLAGQIGAYAASARDNAAIAKTVNASEDAAKGLPSLYYRDI